MKSFVLVITCFIMSFGMEVKASVFHLNQTVDQTVTQAVKEKNWRYTGGEREKLEVEGRYGFLERRKNSGVAFRFVFHDGKRGGCHPLFAVFVKRAER